MATKVVMKHKDTGIMKDGYFGFSWTTFFFGFFPALFRNDYVTFLGGFAISLILGLATFGIAWLVIGIIWAFMYNKYYTRKLLEQGYIFADYGYKNTEAAEALGVTPKRPSSQQSDSEGSNIKCPFCAETIKAEAVICRHCGKDLPKDERTNADTAFERPEWSSFTNENKTTHTHFQDGSDKWKDLREYLLDPIEKRGLRILTGLFVGICSGYVIVAILEMILGFYGSISTILAVIFTAIAIWVSLKKSDNVNKILINMHTVNAILFAIVVLLFFTYSVFKTETHPILARMSLASKIFSAIQFSFLLSIPGLISLFSILKLKGKSVFNVNRNMSGPLSPAYLFLINNTRKRNITLFVILCCLVAIPIVKNMIPMSKAEMDKQEQEFDDLTGVTRIDKYVSFKTDAVHEMPSGTYQVTLDSILTSNGTNVKGEKFAYSRSETFEIDCKERLYRSLNKYDSTDDKESKDQLMKENPPEVHDDWWVNPSDNVDKNLVKLTNYVCSSANKKYKPPVSYSNHSSARQISHLGTYSLVNAEKGTDFTSVVTNAFNLSEFSKMQNEHFKQKTTYETNDEYNSRMLKALDEYNNSVSIFADRNLSSKLISIKLEGVSDYTIQYSPDRKAVTFNLAKNLSTYKIAPENVDFYGEPIFVYKYDGLTFGNKFTRFNSGVEVDRDTAVAYDIVNNPGYLLVTFKLGAKKKKVDQYKDIFRASPSLQVVKCEWIVRDKKLWSWEGGGI